MKIGKVTKYRIEYMDPMFRNWNTTTLFREDHIKPWLKDHAVTSYRVYKIVDEVSLWYGWAASVVPTDDYDRAEKEKARLADAKEGFDQ